MAKSKQTFNKKEKEKKRFQQKQDKQQKAIDRKANRKDGNQLEGMMAYLDENGNLVDTPPNAANKKEFKLEDIRIDVAPREDTPDTYWTGTVSFFNTEKGFGFINERTTKQRVFFHMSELLEPVQENDEVRFMTENGPRGLNALRVSKNQTPNN